MPAEESKNWFLRLLISLGIAAFCFYYFYSKQPESQKIQEQKALPALKSELIAPTLSSGKLDSVNAYLKTQKLSDLSTMIRQDSYCEFSVFRRSQIESGAAQNSFIDDYFALSAANGQSPLSCRGALFAPSGKIALEFARQDKSVSCLFLQGLLLGNFLQGVSIGTKGSEPIEQLNESIALFEYLQAKNPDNGIYSFFLLPLLQKLHRPIEESDKSFRKFLYARDFDNPLTLYGIEILSLGAMNPSAYVSAETLLSGMHMPNYSEPFHVAQELSRDPMFARDLEAWTSRFLSNLQKIEKEGLAEPYVWPMEVMALRRFTSVAWLNQRSTVPLPELLTDDGGRRLLKRLVNHYFETLPVMEGANPDQACKSMIDTIHHEFKSILSGEKQAHERWNQFYQQK